MNFIFFKLKKPQKTWISFFSIRERLGQGILWTHNHIVLRKFLLVSRRESFQTYRTAIRNCPTFPHLNVWLLPDIGWEKVQRVGNSRRNQSNKGEAIRVSQNGNKEEFIFYHNIGKVQPLCRIFGRCRLSFWAMIAIWVQKYCRVF